MVVAVLVVAAVVVGLVRVAAWNPMHPHVHTACRIRCKVLEARSTAEALDVGVGVAVDARHGCDVTIMLALVGAQAPASQPPPARPPRRQHAPPRPAIVLQPRTFSTNLSPSNNPTFPFIFP